MNPRLRLNILDRWLVRIGFNACDVAAMPRRNVYYFAILVMAAVAMTFAALTVYAWIK